jgi:hypothetical protein
MPTIIMTISTQVIVPQAEIERHRQNYANSHHSFVIKYTDGFIPNGYVITKDDNLLEKVPGIDKEDVKVRQQIYDQELKIKDGAKYSRDTSILKGEKPYEPAT